GSARRSPGACSGLRRTPAPPRARRAHTRRIAARARSESDGSGCRLSFSGLPGSHGLFGQAERRGALEVPAEAVGNDFGQIDLRGGDLGDAPIGLADVIAHDHAVYELVFRLHEAVCRITEVQRTHHLQRVERELFEELAIALRVRAQARIGAAGGTARR